MKALLLDLGGVILDIDPRASLAYWATAAGEDVGRVAERWQLDDAYKAFEVGAIDFAEYAAALSRRLAIALSADQWRSGWNALLREPFPAVAKLLPEVASRVPLYCFSNTNAVHQAVWQPQLAELLESFTKVYASWQIGHRKPNVDAYLHVAADMGVPPADIVFVDDNRDNVEGALAAGLDARHAAGEEATCACLRALFTPALWPPAKSTR